MYEFRNLENIELKELSDCLNMAFSDYPIPVKLSESELSDMLIANRADMNLSYGAFYEGELIGFLINSAGLYKGERVVFDVATAIVPEHRGGGVFSNLFISALQELKKEEITQYCLEVLQQNKEAIEIYRKKGFEIIREYSVLKYNNDSNNLDDEEIVLGGCPLSNFDRKNIEGLKSPIPSYEHCEYILAENNLDYNVFYEEVDGISAYLIMTDSGRVMELGYADILSLKKLVENVQRKYKVVSIKNLDMSYTDIMEMLKEIGFQEQTKQYEMSMEIK